MRLTGRRFIGLGAGGHAKMLMEIIALTGGMTAGLVVHPDRASAVAAGDVPVLGGDDDLPQLFAEGYRDAFIGVGTVRASAHRERLDGLAQGIGFATPTLIHPSAVVSPGAAVPAEAGAQLLPRVVVNVGASLGRGVIVNSGAIVEHDCAIGDFAHLGPGAILCASVQVGARAHIGAGAVVRQGVVIGADATVGAGAAVLADVPAGATVVGVPARVR